MVLLLAVFGGISVSIRRLERIIRINSNFRPSKHKHQQPQTDFNTTTESNTMSAQHGLKRSNSSSTSQSESSMTPRVSSSSENTIKRRSSDNKGQPTFMHYGRHSNQWIFEPLMETAKSFFGKS